MSELRAESALNNKVFGNFSQALIRVRYLRENGKFLPLKSFLMRKHYFNDEDSGWLKTQNRPAPANNPMQDPGMMTEMLKGNLTNVIPMIVIGGWINWTFSGFLTTKVRIWTRFGMKIDQRRIRRDVRTDRTRVAINICRQGST